MLEVGVEEPVLGQLWKWLPKQIGQDVSIPLNLRLIDILPTNTRHFSYSGSLTTPPCTEGVRWVILEKPRLISQQDVAQFVRWVREDGIGVTGTCDYRGQCGIQMYVIPVWYGHYSFHATQMFDNETLTFSSDAHGGPS